jgi:hypothetical protein
VHYPASKTIHVSFSEWIRAAEAGKSVSVFPLPPGGITVRAAGKSLAITARRGFAPSTTYHIELSTGLKDLRGNALSVPYRLVFSTGAALDSGVLSGCIAAPVDRSAPPVVALFAARAGAIAAAALLDTPDYAAHTDSMGFFSLSNLRTATYAIVAFADKNGDNRLQPAAEPAFAPAMRTIAVDAAPKIVPLYPVSADTTPARVALLRPISASVALGQWDRPGGSPAGPRWRIEPVSGSFKAPTIAGYIPIGGSTRFALSFSGALELTGYRLIFTSFRPANDSAPELIDTLRFNGTAASDTIPPSLQLISPRTDADLLPRVRIAASEPVALASRRFFAADSMGDTVQFIGDTAYADTITLHIQRRMKPDSRYRMLISWKSVHDLSGNTARDTADSEGLRIEIRTIAAENLCTSLSGSAPCATEAKRLWQFTPLSGGRVALSAGSAGAFRFDSLPASRGTISYFVDADGDSLPDKGTLFPWRQSEISVSFGDTIEARARWDISGIRLLVCEPCAAP